MAYNKITISNIMEILSSIFLKSLIIRLIIAMIIGITIGTYGSELLIKFVITFRAFFSAFLMFYLPIMVLICIVESMVCIKYNLKKLTMITIIISYVFTVLTGSYSLLINTMVLNYAVDVEHITGVLNSNMKENIKIIEPFNNFLTIFKPVLEVMSAFFLAFLVGFAIALSSKENKYVRQVIHELYDIFIAISQYFIGPLIPVFIVSVMCDITYQGLTGVMIFGLYKIFFIIIFLHISILLMHYIAAGMLTSQNPFKMMKNMLPAYFTGLGCQSSFLTAPLTSAGMQKNGADRAISDYVSFVCASFHMPGVIATVVTTTSTVLIIYDYKITLMDMFLYILSLAFVVAAAPGIPGAPALMSGAFAKAYFGLTDLQAGLIISMHLMQLSSCVGCNCCSDGGLVFYIDKISSIFGKDEKANLAKTLKLENMK